MQLLFLWFASLTLDYAASKVYVTENSNESLSHR